MQWYNAFPVLVQTLEDVPCCWSTLLTVTALLKALFPQEVFDATDRSYHTKVFVRAKGDGPPVINDGFYVVAVAQAEALTFKQELQVCSCCGGGLYIHQHDIKRPQYDINLGGALPEPACICCCLPGGPWTGVRTHSGTAAPKRAINYLSTVVFASCIISVFTLNVICHRDINFESLPPPPCARSILPRPHHNPYNTKRPTLPIALQRENPSLDCTINETAYYPGGYITTS